MLTVLYIKVKKKFDPRLAQWIVNQRANRRYNILSPYRIAKLDLVGMDWNPRKPGSSSPSKAAKSKRKRSGSFDYESSEDEEEEEEEELVYEDEEEEEVGEEERKKKKSPTKSPNKSPTKSKSPVTTQQQPETKVRTGRLLILSENFNLL